MVGENRGDGHSPDVGQLDPEVIPVILASMTAVAERLRTELTQLTENERGELAYFLIQSLDPQTDEDAEGFWDSELERREVEIRSGHLAGTSADQVFSYILAKHS